MPASNAAIIGGVAMGRLTNAYLWQLDVNKQGIGCCLLQGLKDTGSLISSSMERGNSGP